jgi:hypothetical protein
MSLQLLVDAERLVGDYLRAHTDVTALVGDRVYTQNPPNADKPYVRFQRIGGRTEVWRHFERSRITFEAWADSEVDAWEVAATVQAAMKEAEETTHDLGVVTFVGEALGLRNQPDPETNSPRYLFDALVYMHPDPNGS